MVGIDQERVCRECQRPFLFTIAEQAYYAEQGFQNKPQRCPTCRGNRRRQREGLAPREMHQVICAACGAPTAVPFLPRNARPVLCSFCFERQRLEPQSVTA